MSKSEPTQPTAKAPKRSPRAVFREDARTTTALVRDGAQDRQYTYIAHDERDQAGRRQGLRDRGWEPVPEGSPEYVADVPTAEIWSRSRDLEHAAWVAKIARSARHEAYRAVQIERPWMPQELIRHFMACQSGRISAQELAAHIYRILDPEGGE
jgi:hypothetical protein